MKVLIDKSFNRDVKKIESWKIKETIAVIIEEVREAVSIKEIAQCKKLRGSKNAFRIRTGNYRIGFVYENETVIFIRFLHRGKIYSYFP